VSPPQDRPVPELTVLIASFNACATMTGAVAWRLRRAPQLYLHFLAAVLPLFLGSCTRSWGEMLGYWQPWLNMPGRQNSSTADQ
jgi:hypothetical protein